MKFLLTAINAKYIHSNLGVHSLKAYAKAHGCKNDLQIELAEYTINQSLEEILQDIYLRKPGAIGFSCYIWNIQYVIRLIRNLSKILPDVDIWLGGPEVSYCAKEVMTREPSVTGIMVGEGEASFEELMTFYMQSCPRKVHRNSLSEIGGIVFRDLSGNVVKTKSRPLLNLDDIPFPYEELEGMEHRIIYYESSRGCPYSCSYCLSSIDKKVRFRSLELVKKELDYFLEHKVPQVKFVDRTFNCKKSHALSIWRYLLEHDNGITNFHFEIAADLIDEEELEVLKQMRLGLIQLEIGVQTTNPETITEINRKMDLTKLKNVVTHINSFQNIHQHLDLIAGLPYENIESFKKSFDEVYRMRPQQLQLGFLKVLTGSPMAERAKEYQLQFREEPPYEVLSTSWLSFDDVLELKAVENMVELHYNSRQFTETLKEMEKHWKSPYAMFADIARYYRKRKLSGMSHGRLARYEILFEFLKELKGQTTNQMERYRDLLMYDIYLRENAKSRPTFARNLGPYKHKIRKFFEKEELRQVGKMVHLEIMGDGSMVLFDYRERNPLTYNAKAVRVDE